MTQDNVFPSAEAIFADLNGAMQEAIAHVKRMPQDMPSRLRYIDLLIADGAYERADKQADILSNLNPGLAVGVALLHGRIRAADARRAWFQTHAVPECPLGPTPCDQAAMRQMIQPADQSDAFTFQGCAARVNGIDAPAFRDIDDRIPHAFEAFASDGRYLWLDFSLLERVDFTPPQRLRDLIWRIARFRMRDGSSAEFATPAAYFAQTQTNAQKFAQETDWILLADNRYAGVGQKTFLVGDDALGALELKTVEFL